MAISMEMGGRLRLAEVFRTSLKAFGRHAVVFIPLSAIAHVPSLSLFLWSFMLVHSVRELAGFFLLISMGLHLVFVVGLVCVLIAYGAMMYGVIADLGGRRASIAEAVAIATRRVLPLVGVSVAAAELNRLLFSGWVAWGIYCLVMGVYFVAAPVCVAEGAGVGAIPARCRFLTRGRGWQIFGAVLLVAIVSRPFANIFLFAGVTRSSEAIVASCTAIFSIWIVFGAFNAVLAAVFYDRLRLTRDGVHMIKIFD